MAVILSTLLVFFMLVFGGTGATVLAAQSSLPDQPLYGVKLASETVRAGIPASSQSRVDLAMDFADLRLQEALQLASEGKPIPATVWERMDNFVTLGLSTAAGLDDEQLAQQLTQIQSRLQTELAQLSQLKADSRYSDTAASVWAALLTRQQLVTIGLSDPAAFREYMQSDQNHSRWQLDPTASPTPASTATPLPTDPALTSTATAQPTIVPTSTVTALPTATLQPKIPATQIPNPGTNPNGHPAGCCCDWCMGQRSGQGEGGSTGGHHDGHDGGGRHH